MTKALFPESSENILKILNKEQEPAAFIVCTICHRLCYLYGSVKNKHISKNLSMDDFSEMYKVHFKKSF